MTRRTRWLATAALGSVLLLAGCTGSDVAPSTAVDPSAQVITLPEAGADIDFDDTTYSAELGRVLVPARDEGAYLVDPDTGDVSRVPYAGPADSLDAGAGVLFVADRDGKEIRVVDPGTGRVTAVAGTTGPPDYVRYVARTSELWVSEPGEGTDAIEVFGIADDPATPPRAGALIPVPDGPEGMTLAANGRSAWVHAGDDVVAVDIEAREVRDTWPTGCDGTHGFVRVAEQARVLLASCADDGKVVLLDLDDGSILDDYSAGDGESLPAYSPETGHFYVRSDPGTRIVVLDPSGGALTRVDAVDIPEVGHCLGAAGDHYWTCDAQGGRILLFTDRG